MICSNTLQIYRIVQQLTGLLKLHSHSRVKVLVNLQFAHELSTEAKLNTAENVKDVIPEKKATKLTIHELKQYLQEIRPELLSPKTYACVQVSRSRPQDLWLVDDVTAEKIASYIIHDIPKDSIIVEINPGLALLSKHLLTTGVKELILLEKKKHFINNLTKFIAAVDRNVNISLHRSEILLSKYLNSIITTENVWTANSPVTIISAISSATAITKLMQEHSFRDGFLGHGLPELYFIMYPSVYEGTKNTSMQFHPRPSQILIQNLYDIELLGTVDRATFIPWHFSVASYPLKRFYSTDEEILYIVKFKPKANLHTLNISQEEVFIYRRFLSSLLRAPKSSNLIQRIEKQLPGFGLKLIQLDYNMSTRLSDISASEYLTIFKLAMKWPEFNTTNFGYQLKKKATNRSQETELNEYIDVVDFHE